MSFRLVVPHDSGSSTLNPSFRLRNLYLATEHSSGARIDVDTRVPTSGISIGGIRIGPPELTLLALVALYPTLLFFARRRRAHANRKRSESPHAPVLALVIAVGFWTIFAAMAWRDWQTINAWRQTTSTIGDVVVIPGFGGAYFCALLPLPLFIYGFMAIRRGGHYNS